MIPVDARKPANGRFKAAESLLAAIDRKKSELDTRRLLTKGEEERLTEEFVIEYTYNSNAIEGNTLTLHEIEIIQIILFPGLYVSILNSRGFILLLVETAGLEGCL